MYLENPVVIPLVHLETLDGHGTSRVYSVIHFCESTMIVDPPNAYKFLSENIRGRYGPLGFADLSKKP